MSPPKNKKSTPRTAQHNYHVVYSRGAPLVKYIFLDCILTSSAKQFQVYFEISSLSLRIEIFGSLPRIVVLF